MRGDPIPHAHRSFSAKVSTLTGSWLRTPRAESPPYSPVRTFRSARKYKGRRRSPWRRPSASLVMPLSWAFRLFRLLVTTVSDDARYTPSQRPVHGSPHFPVHFWTVSSSVFFVRLFGVRCFLRCAQHEIEAILHATQSLWRVDDVCDAVSAVLPMDQTVPLHSLQVT